MDKDPAPTRQEEPSPFERLKAFTAAVLAVPKTEVDRREEEWRKGRKDAASTRATSLSASPAPTLPR